MYRTALAYLNRLGIGPLAILAFAICTGRSYGLPADDYLVQDFPRRWALVVGNANYKNAAKLPGAVLDADEISALLNKLQFDVTEVKDVETRTQFIEIDLLPFLSKIQKGDVVVFYFSGHGFTYAGEDYVAPLAFPPSVKSNDIFSTFINVRSVVDLIGEKNAGFVLVLLDACRSIGDFIDPTDNEGKSLLAKGLADARVDLDNVSINYSSDIGTVSYGSAADQVSVYTSGIKDVVPSSKEDWDRIKKKVRTLVRLKTKNQQTPWFSESSSAEFYFNLSPEIVTEQRQLWQDAIAEGTVTSVEMFLARYGTGPYGDAARRWLENHPNAPEARASAISPQYADALWLQPESKIAEVPGPLRPASVQVRNSWYVPIDWASKVDTSHPISTKPIGGIPARQVDKWLTPSRDTAIVTSVAEAKSRPEDYANTIRVLEPGTAVRVTGSEKDTNDVTWNKIDILGVGSAYVKELPSDTSLDFGSQLSNLQLKPLADGIRGAMDSTPLITELSTLKATGHDINWISLAVGKPANPAAENLLSLRALSIIGRLVNYGIPRDKITVTQAQRLNLGETIEIRIYGGSS